VRDALLPQRAPRAASAPLARALAARARADAAPAPPPPLNGRCQRALNADADAIARARVPAPPRRSPAAVSPSLKNLLLSVLAGGSVLAVIAVAVVAVSNFDKCVATARCRDALSQAGGWLAAPEARAPPAAPTGSTAKRLASRDGHAALQ
jgi:hypothetical protein